MSGLTCDVALQFIGNTDFNDNSIFGASSDGSSGFTGIVSHVSCWHIPACGLHVVMYEVHALHAFWTMHVHACRHYAACLLLHARHVQQLTCLSLLLQN